MASVATIPRSGHVAWLIHFFFPSRRQVVFFLVTEVALTAVGAPLWVHLVAGGLLHLAVRRADS